MSYRDRDRETREGKKLLDEFDPAKKKLPRPSAATFAPFRHPQWKTYSNVGHAKNAMTHHRFIIRYEWDDGHALSGEGEGWREVERREAERRYT
jgi:hypothetical protein